MELVSLQKPLIHLGMERQCGVSFFTNMRRERERGREGERERIETCDQASPNCTIVKDIGSTLPSFIKKIVVP